MRVKATINIDYDEATLGDVNIIRHLEESLEYWISNGGLTGDSPAIVDEHRVEIEKETK